MVGFAINCSWESGMNDFIGKMIYRTHQTQCPLLPVQVRGSGNVIFPRVLYCFSRCADGWGGRNWGSSVRPAIARLNFAKCDNFDIIRIDVIGKRCGGSLKSWWNDILHNLMRGNAFHGGRLGTISRNTFDGPFEYLCWI